MKIRKAKREDIPVLAKLSAKLGYSADEDLMRCRFEAISNDLFHSIYVAVSDEENVVGWIHIFPRILLISRPIAEIGGLIVEESYRRRGIAKKLIKKAEDWAFRNGYEGIIVRSNAGREESHHFYPAAGYDFLKEQKVYIKYS